MPIGIYTRTKENRENRSKVMKLIWQRFGYRENQSKKHKGEFNSGHFKKGHKLGMTGKKHSQETKEKMRIARIKGKGFKDGHIAWNKGKSWSKEIQEQISKAHKGKHLSPNTEFKKGLTPWNKGLKGFNAKEKHSLWQGGISKEPYSFDFNDELKNFIRKRDNYQCQNKECNMTEEEHLIVYGINLHIHHIDYDKKNCKEDNLISLCCQCNARANFNRKYWKEYFLKSKFWSYKDKESFGEMGYASK